MNKEWFSFPSGKSDKPAAYPGILMDGISQIWIRGPSLLVLTQNLGFTGYGGMEAGRSLECEVGVQPELYK